VTACACAPAVGSIAWGCALGIAAASDVVSVTVVAEPHPASANVALATSTARTIEEACLQR
jgi:predicted solute-binding protein